MAAAAASIVSDIAIQTGLTHVSTCPRVPDKNRHLWRSWKVPALDDGSSANHREPRPRGLVCEVGTRHPYNLSRGNATIAPIHPNEAS